MRLDIIPNTLLQGMSALQHFAALQTILTAVDMNIFGLLQDWKTPVQLAKEQHWDDMPLSIFLDTLFSLGLLEKRGLKYKATREATQKLTYESNPDVMSVLMHWSEIWRGYVNIIETIRGESKPKRTCIHQKDQLRLQSHINILHHMGERAVKSILNLVHFDRIKHLVDVGCGSGIYTIEILKAYPKLTATVFDHKPVVKIAGKKLEKEHLIKRATVVSGDFFKEPIPSGDCLLLSSILCGFNDKDKKHILDKCYNALPAGGILIVHSHCLSEKDPQSNVYANIFSMNMLAQYGEGGAMTLRDLEDMLYAAGFDSVKILGQSILGHYILEAKK